VCSWRYIRKALASRCEFIVHLSGVCFALNANVAYNLVYVVLHRTFLYRHRVNSIQWRTAIVFMYADRRSAT